MEKVSIGSIFRGSATGCYIFYIIVKAIMQCTTTSVDVLTYVHTVSVPDIF